MGASIQFPRETNGSRTGYLQEHRPRDPQYDHGGSGDRHARIVLRQHDRRDHRIRDREGSRRDGALRMDGHGIPAMRNGDDPRGGEAVRYLRKENSVPHRARHLHRRFDHSGTLGEHGDVHRLSRHPGFRRRDPHPRGHGRGRRPLRSKRQREGPGALRCRVRYRKRDRTPHRRIHRGCGLMALVLLHQPPSSPSSVPADDQEVPDTRRRRRQAHRLQGYRYAVRASAGLHPADPDGRQGVRMGQLHDRDHDRHRRRGPGDIHQGGTQGRRPHPRSPSHAEQDRRQRLDLHVHLRGSG